MLLKKDAIKCHPNCNLHTVKLMNETVNNFTIKHGISVEIDYLIQQRDEVT